MSQKNISRRRLLELLGLGVAGTTLAACQPKVVKETVVVEKEKVVKEEVEVEKEVTRVVEEEGPASPEEIHLRYGTHSFGEQLPGFMTMMDRFNEEQEKIYVAVEAKPWQQYWQALETQCAAGIAPDVVWSGMRAHVPFIEGDALLDVTGYIEAEGIDLSDWFGEGKASYYKGKYYGMPFGVGVVILYYNKTLFDEEGLDYPDETWDWSDWREAAQALTQDTNDDGAIDQWGMWLANNMEITTYPLMLSNGGRWMNGMHVTEKEAYWEKPSGPIEWSLGDCEASVEALTWWIENICEFEIQPKSGEITLAPGAGDEFAAGIVATRTGGTWYYNRYKHVTAFEWDIAPLPVSPNTGERMTTFNLMPNWVTSSTNQPDAAWELAKWNAMDFAQEILGENKIKFPCLKRASDSYMQPPPDNVEIIPEAFDYGWSLSTESYIGNLEVSSVVGRELDYAFLCEKSAQQAAEDATKAANDILAGL